MSTMHRVGLDPFLGGEKTPKGTWSYFVCGAAWQNAADSHRVPQRVITESLARGDAQGARTALRMLGALGTEQHPVWDVLAAAGEEGAR